ncbi:hypothetical protein NBRC116590_14590 [Pelagimonas sp. KU-00592-HH]|uniref:hypothetical protein n=1 Tax=Pelagimonas sp. KU-00592-HH TaxID=3127651 RepID=UPI0031095FA6
MSLTDTNPVIETTEDTHHDEVISKSGLAMIYAVLAAVVVAWGSAVYAFGIPGLYMPAVALVPVIWVILLIISRG